MSKTFCKNMHIIFRILIFNNMCERFVTKMFKKYFTVCVFYQFIKILVFSLLIEWYGVYCVLECICYTKRRFDQKKLDAVGFSPFSWAIFHSCVWYVCVLCVCLCKMHSNIWNNSQQHLHTNYMAQTINDCLIKLLNHAIVWESLKWIALLYLACSLRFFSSLFFLNMHSFVWVKSVCVLWWYVFNITFALLWINRNIEYTFLFRKYMVCVWVFFSIRKGVSKISKRRKKCDSNSKENCLKY